MPLLLAVLLVQICFLGGSLAASVVRRWQPEVLPGRREAGSAIARWRQAVYDRADDPRVGDAAPPLRLKQDGGHAFSLADLEGRKAVVLFVKDEAG